MLQQEHCLNWVCQGGHSQESRRIVSVRVLVVDDHAAVRQSVVQVLEAEPDFEVVGQASDGHTAVDLVKDLHPDIIIMDVIMPQTDGIDATRQIVGQYPSVKVIALSIHAYRSYVARMLGAGAFAYVLKDDGVDELMRALRAVRRGRTYISDTIIDRLEP